MPNEGGYDTTHAQATREKVSGILTHPLSERAFDEDTAEAAANAATALIEKLRPYIETG